MQLFAADTTIFFFLNKKKKRLSTKSWKKHSQKLPWAAQTEEFMFQIAAYRPTV